MSSQHLSFESKVIVVINCRVHHIRLLPVVRASREEEAESVADDALMEGVQVPVQVLQVRDATSGHKLPSRHIEHHHIRVHDGKRCGHQEGERRKHDQGEHHAVRLERLNWVTPKHQCSTAGKKQEHHSVTQFVKDTGSE